MHCRKCEPESCYCQIEWTSSCMWIFRTLENNLSSPKPWPLTGSNTKPQHTAIHGGLPEEQHSSPGRLKWSFHIYTRNHCLLQFQREVYSVITEGNIYTCLYFPQCWVSEPFQCSCSLDVFLHWQLCVTHCFSGGGPPTRSTSPATQTVGAVADKMATRSKNQNDLDGTSHLPIMHGIDDTGYVYAAGVYKPSIFRGKNCVNLSCTAVRGGGGGWLK